MGEVVIVIEFDTVIDGAIVDIDIDTIVDVDIDIDTIVVVDIEIDTIVVVSVSG